MHVVPILYAESLCFLTFLTVLVECQVLLGAQLWESEQMQTWQVSQLLLKEGAIIPTSLLPMVPALQNKTRQHHPQGLE